SSGPSASSLPTSAHLQALHSVPTRRSSDLARLPRLRRDGSQVIDAEPCHGTLHAVRSFRSVDFRAAWRDPHPDRRQRLGSAAERSEEHTSELQSRENLVCRLLLEKKQPEGR